MMAQPQSSLKTLERAASELAAALKLPLPRGRLEREALCLAARRAIDSPDLRGVALSSDQWQDQETDLRTLLTAGLALVRIHTGFDHLLTSNAWDQDLYDVRQTLAARGGRWWRRLSGEYRRANNRLTGLLRPPRASGVEARTRLVEAVLEAQRQQALIKQYECLAQGLIPS